MDEIEVYRSGLRRKWRWRYKAAGNHEKLANGNEGYVELSDLLDSMCRVTGLYREELAPWPADEHVLRRPGSDELISVVIERG